MPQIMIQLSKEQNDEVLDYKRIKEIPNKSDAIIDLIDKALALYRD